jgi:hypothetical protein
MIAFDHSVMQNKPKLKLKLEQERERKIDDRV